MKRGSINAGTGRKAVKDGKPKAGAARKPLITSSTRTPRNGGVPQGAGGDWRAATLERMRTLILQAVPGMIEERKWRKPSNAMAGVPVWSHRSAGMVCTGETYAKVVKFTFAKGASLEDPSRLFNASLAGGTRRAIDIREGESVDARAFRALVKSAVEAGGRGAVSKPRAVKLLSGGNPQIAKADGDAPVQAYIRAMSGGGPGWKRDLGQRLDALIERTVPGVRKAVRWNSPFYGVDAEDGKVNWFLAVHVFTKYVKIAFFNGTSLTPVPPGGTPKSKDTRWIDIREGDALDESQVAAWVTQAASLPGWVR